MIRINLLPVRAKKKRNTSLYQLAGIVAALLVTFAAGVSVHLVYAGKVDQTAKKIEDQQTEIKRLEKIIGEVKELEKQRARLESQLGVITKLEKGKRGPVRVLDELSNGIPKRVWITSFREQGGTLTLEGSAIENADISEFMRSMQKSAYFTDIQLKFTQSDVRDSVAIYVFRIECRVNYTA
jgi:type IV pilus assembly protein PilN